MNRPRFVVLDRDGTLIVERNYLSDPAQVALLPGAAAGLRAMTRMGLGLIVVTNQSGIGRGLFSEKRLGEIHLRMMELLGAEGIELRGIYYCPHTPEDQCDCRKPKPLLLNRAAAELGFSAAESFVIGDKISDIEMGRQAGATTLLVTTGYGSEEAGSGAAQPDFVVADLEAAAAKIELILAGPKHG